MAQCVRGGAVGPVGAQPRRPPAGVLGCLRGAAGRASRRYRQAMRAVEPLVLALALCVNVAESVHDISHLTKVNPPGGISGSLLTRRKLPRPETLPPDPAAFLVDIEVEGTRDGQPKQSLGTFTLKVNPTWAPLAAGRFKEVRAQRRVSRRASTPAACGTAHLPLSARAAGGGAIL